jgi:dUTP pyrophosphatase
MHLLRIRDLRTDAPTVELKVLDERIRAWGLPRYQSEMAAAVDLFACLDGPLMVAAQSAAQFVPAGIAIHIADPSIAAIIVPRSGLGHKKGLVLGNLVGVLDADYTGPVMISVWNRSEAGSPPIVIEPGDRIAQLMFVPVVRPAFEVVDEFSRLSLRGAGGFGSTGQ